MKTIKNKYRSKRSSSGLSKRQLFIVAGAFLVSPLFLAPQVSAQSPEETKPVVELRPVDASPLLLSEKENEAKIKHVEDTYRIQSELIQARLAELNKAKEETANISQTKLTLEEEVAAMKAEIEVMKARVAEKKALEAEQARLDAARSSQAQSVAPQSNPSSYRGSSNNAGNRYTPGQCTWYVYNMRPDIGSFWGNASQWLYNAQADGYATSSRPQVGAIAWTGAGYAGHVAYVQGVSGDMVTISEMNYAGPYQISTRTVHYSEFQYILW